MRSFVFLLVLGGVSAVALTPEEAEGRLRMAVQIARERNDRALVARVEKLGREFKAELPADAEVRLREAETAVGIDPGGWAMAGQPLFHPTAEMKARQAELNARLAEAMKSDDAAQVRAVTREMLKVLGDQAGVPDGRRAGKKAEPVTLGEAEATRLFVEALKSEGRRVRQLSEGRPFPDQMLRLYADVLNGVTHVRPFAEKHQPEAVVELDRLTSGVAGMLVRLQQPAGFFPFPDLRGKNIRFGAMITRQVEAGTVEVKDGWVISADPDGGTQFDTGVCGAALLQAGVLHQNAEWKQAGLRAADWALAQKCCANFNYNAFSVSLLTQAYLATGDMKYLEGALKKFRVGVAPGQAPNGRWMDAHNARTVYHVIIVRGLGELAMALTLPKERLQEREEVDAVLKPALQALLDEFDAMGLTVEALPELKILTALYPEDGRLKTAVQSMEGSIIGKCTDGKQVKMGASVTQLAWVVGVKP
ncbi:hypothetical protein [Prosthecobacter sp.]|uniref:hypothetical protein n=1 Tax=Prosthecobacter sp. TaxID=1965333 RepID=UPI003782E669